MTKKSNFDENAESSQIEDTNSTSSRRRLLVGATVPAVLSLISLPAFGRGGARCTISGFTSVNPSGVRHDVNGCGGYSPGAWKNPYAGNGDGSLADWIQAGKNCASMTGALEFSDGFFPNPESTSSGGKRKKGKTSSSDSGDATLFQDVFGGSDTDTLHDKLMATGNSLDRAAVDALLNSCFFEWGVGVNSSKMHPVDVVGLYQTNTGSKYTSSILSLIHI